jgi:putative solute:sodium symporter small subunit
MITAARKHPTSTVEVRRKAFMSNAEQIQTHADAGTHIGQDTQKALLTNAERMQTAYKKQCRVTLITAVVVTLMTHIFPMYFLFPGLNDMRIFGFPADYWLTIVIGWLLVLPVLWLYIEVSEKVDQEINDSSSDAQDSTQGGQP